MIDAGIVLPTVHAAPLMIQKMKEQPILERLIGIGHAILPEQALSQVYGLVKIVNWKVIFVKHASDLIVVIALPCLFITNLLRPANQ